MLRVRLLGGLEVDAGVAGASEPAGRPARLVLGWLAAFPGEHARAEVAARLWPDVLDSSARASLRTALSELRAALGPAAVHVRATRETVQLRGQGLWVDLRAFCELIDAGQREEALALCRGEVLEGLDEEWVLGLRSRHAAERAEEAVAQLIHVAEIVDPDEVIADIEADAADNRVLEAAAAGNVAAIVSGDRHLLGLAAWRGIPIQTPAAFAAESE
jgi:DNA-binding SARP family transcriptional activator